MVHLEPDVRPSRGYRCSPNSLIPFHFRHLVCVYARRELSDKYQSQNKSLDNLDYETTYSRSSIPTFEYCVQTLEQIEISAVRLCNIALLQAAKHSNLRIGDGGT